MSVCTNKRSRADKVFSSSPVVGRVNAAVAFRAFGSVTFAESDGGINCEAISRSPKV